MKHYILLLLSAFYTTMTMAQTQPKSIVELINTTDSGWPIVTEWVKKAKNKVDVLPVDTLKAKDALLGIQVTTRSAMGAIVYHSGGILVDNGWIRILGSGNTKLNRTLPEWNKDKAKEYLLIADDVVGGFFALNSGGLGNDPGKVYYFSPDNLEFEPLEITYSQFIDFCFNSDLNSFYQSMRWKDWKSDVEKLDGNQVFNFYPFLWSEEGKDIEKNKRNIVPVQEQYLFNLDAREQLHKKQ